MSEVRGVIQYTQPFIYYVIQYQRERNVASRVEKERQKYAETIYLLAIYNF